MDESGRGTMGEPSASGGHGNAVSFFAARHTSLSFACIRPMIGSPAIGVRWRMCSRSALVQTVQCSGWWSDELP